MTLPEHLYLKPSDDLQKAFDSASPGDVLHLRAGVYRQKTVLRTPGVTLTGEGPDRTIIAWDDYAQKKDEFLREYNTFRTYTMAVCADNVTMRSLAIVNDAGDPQLKGQEVALSVLGDRFVMEDCRLSSTQDTLFAGPLPPDLIERYDGFLASELRASGPFSQRYTRCLIEGSVDFIFGCADAVFADCEIRSVYDVRQVGYAAAPAHGLEQTEGFVFSRCHFTCAPEVNPASIYLARPWRDYGLARFEHCAYGAHIAPAGFDKWNDTHRDKTARFYEHPSVPGRVSWARSQENGSLCD
ncbi:MAG: pectin esterase [Clostridiales bacterium]|nr:pectin esterase [Clostridiales bacterium]